MSNERKENVEIVTAVHGPEECAAKIKEITGYCFETEIAKF